MAQDDQRHPQPLTEVQRRHPQAGGAEAGHSDSEDDLKQRELEMKDVEVYRYHSSSNV